ncbi:LysM peptidoglycan-binding domain-containing protein [Marinoscillum sp. MHG1-6]|uniref:LysM peptidoglycan-binding domain-containing protein n=1 Tax=Marinoscillum sp. MHG1-6 TaxID=2959627 RepID=UPI002157C185|nr:LysM peptidoglycan-binding domain-containing protein [Marinoscillum sp. MHG1-6]
MQQYIKAMRFYKEVLDQEPTHLGALFQMGECYRLTFDYESATHYYERVAKSKDRRFPLAKYYYAQMLKQAGEFNMALQEYEEFIDNLRNEFQHESNEYRVYYNQAKIEKEGCLLALNDLTNPKPDHGFRLCSDVNTEYMDFAAFSYGNEQYMCLTSSRTSGKGNLIDYRFGESFADIFLFKNEGGQWQKYVDDSRLEKMINTKWGDGSGSFNRDGTKFYYTNCNEELGDFCHIYVSVLRDGQWSTPVALGEAVNLYGYDSRHPNITPGGDTLFFASNRPGGEGNYDIWMSLNAGGENWSQPINLGSQLNTPFIEVAPFFDPEQKALFFSSDGHRGYGGFDIYMAKGNSFFDPEIFNPGSPFNSNKDEVFITMGKNKGYLSSNREGGKGKLDIYEFDIENEEEIITEISLDQSVAGRNSVFSDDFDFDYDEVATINEIISMFMAARIVDVELALTSDLAKVYRGLSLDDKERINRIIFARIRQLNENDLQAFRVEDEMFYQDLSSSDKGHLDRLILTYIEENGLSLSIGNTSVGEERFYSSLEREEKERVDRLIATRVKQANTYEYEPTTYQALPKADRAQVDQIAYKYFEDKTILDRLTISPTQMYYLRNLTPEKKLEVYQSVKERVMVMSEDNKYKLQEDDRIFYQNLTSEQISAVREIANAFIVADLETISEELDPKVLNVYSLMNQTQQRTLNRVLAKIIENTIKGDLYYAESNLTEEAKLMAQGIVPERIGTFMDKQTSTIELTRDKERIERFLTVSAKSWISSDPVYVKPLLVPQTLVAANTVEAPSNQTPGLTQNNEQNKNSGYGGTSNSGKNSTGLMSANGAESRQNEQNASQKMEPEAQAVGPTLPTNALSFYEEMSVDQQLTVDRIVAMEYMNRAYSNPSIRQEDDQFLKDASKEERKYIKLLSDHLRGDLSQVEGDELALNEAYTYYSSLSPTLKTKWNRLVARGALVETSVGKYKISPSDAAFRMRLGEEERESLASIQEFRFANESFLAEDLHLGSDEMVSGMASYEVAQFNNSEYNNVSIKGLLINNQGGAPIADFPLQVVNEEGKMLASVTTGKNGVFLFEGLPKGEFKVVSGLESEAGKTSVSVVVKDLKVMAAKTPSMVAVEETPRPEEKTPQKINPIVEEEQRVQTLSSYDLLFYEEKTAEQQLTVDRILAMEYINRAYTDPILRQKDDQFLKDISKEERIYIKLLADHLSGDVSVAEADKLALNEAFTFYSNLAPTLKSKWNRLVARGALIETSTGKFKISPSDAAFRMKLDEADRKSLANIQNFRFANERILSENLAVESNDLAYSKVNFGVAKFNNTEYNYVSVKGRLIKNEDGTPMADFPLQVVNETGKIIARVTTSSNGDFAFEDLPRGEYKVVSGREKETDKMSASFFVKDLKVMGTDEGSFMYTLKTNIYFDFGSSDLRNEAYVSLREIAEICKKQDVYIQLRSHTDNVGNEDYNLLLSDKRNEQAISLLKAQGVSTEKMEWLAMGKSNPAASNKTAYGRQFNRRIEISLKSNNPIEYEPAEVFIVRPKGTLFSIARNFGVAISDILKINGMTDNSLKAYQPLRIPNPNGMRPNLDMLVELGQSVADSHNIYVVKEGETIRNIADKFNIPYELIIEMNEMKGEAVRTGQELKIYVRNF